MSEDEQVSRPSRYRSLRRPADSTPALPNANSSTSSVRKPEQQYEGSATNSISRSMSRYRRRAASAVGEMDSPAVRAAGSDPKNAPPVPAIPSLLKTGGSPTMTGGQTESMAGPVARRQLGHIDTSLGTINPTTSDHENYDNRAIGSNGNRSGLNNPNVQQGSVEQRDVSWEAQRDWLLEEQKRKDLRRLEEELENSQKAKAQSHKIMSPVVEKFVLLAKGGKGNKDGVSPTTAPARLGSQRLAHEPAKAPPSHIEPDGRGVIPQIDAPTSAINNGGRIVKVRCQHQTLSLPVSPDTTTVDIVAQASRKSLSDLKLRPRDCLVIEQYSVLGLERRLRPHEHIRDVMNSWDKDSQNQLAAIFMDPNGDYEDFDSGAAVNREDTPQGCQLCMYHSNRPGKWNKRWVTLLESGQIVSAKKPNAKTTDKDTASLCHLSDYDIYNLIESQKRRHIKPPKRFCFAIKSQHKTTLFLNTENYVHYFSTDDPEVAREFKQRAHGWRSKYLLDRAPAAPKRQPDPGATKGQSPPRSSANKPNRDQSDGVISVDGHRLRVSVDESPYAIGQFEPLLDMTRFEKRLSQFGQDFLPPETDPPAKPKPKPTTGQSTSRRLSLRKKPDHKLPQDTKRENDDGFTGGLLGEVYDSRKQALADLEQQKRPQEQAFTEGPSLLNRQRNQEFPADQLESPSWFPSALAHTAKQHTSPKATAAQPSASIGEVHERRFSLNAAARPQAGLASASRPSTQNHSQHSHSHTQTHTHSNPPSLHPDQRIPPKPLLDLTPTFQEPPQWSKDKKGHGVKPPEGHGHLVNFISSGNGPDKKIGGHPAPPPRTTLRRPTTSGGASLGRSRSMSSASAPKRLLLDDAPPMPLLQFQPDHETSSGGRRLANGPSANSGTMDHQDALMRREREQERTRQRERGREQRERDYREREAAYNAVPGRTGTLRVV